jgi:hypothetical protein
MKLPAPSRLRQEGDSHSVVLLTQTMHGGLRQTNDSQSVVSLTQTIGEME